MLAGLEAVEKRLKHAEEDNRDLADLHAEQRALDRDPEAEVSDNGKPIRRQRQRKDHLLKPRELFALLNDTPPISLKHAAAFLQGVRDISLMFGTASAATSARQPLAGGSAAPQIVFSEEQVSAQTATRLAAEARRIDALYEQAARIPDPARRAQRLSEVVEIAESQDMRQNPATLAFVHDIQRVLEEERKNNLHSTQACTHTICVFSLRADAGSGRKLRVTIGDQYDTDPADTIKDTRNAPEPRPV